MPTPTAATTTELAATASPPLDPSEGPILRSGPLLHQHRSDRPSWHPEDCNGPCCWREAEIRPREPARPAPSELDSFLVRRLVDPVVDAHGFPVTGPTSRPSSCRSWGRRRCC
jgi:hypothetical protein